MASAQVHEIQSKRHGVIYRIRYNYVDPTTGARQRPWQTMDPGTTRKQAEAAMRRGLTALDEGRLPVASDRTVQQLLKEWMDLDVEPRLEATTTAGYADTVRVHLVPALGHLPLRKLTPATMQRWELEYRQTHGYRTVQLCHVRLKQACAFGVRMGRLSHNPLDDVRPPATEAKPRKAWSADDAALFLTCAAQDVYAPLWHFLLGTGCRRGEALGLRWCDVDMKTATARIVQTVRPLHGQVTIKPPKNPQSARTVPLHTALLARLKAHHVTQGKHRFKMGTAYTNLDLVFASSVGTPINPNNVTRAFVALVEKSGVPRITVHQLRHSAGSLALASGATLEEIRQLLGHKKLATTADIYVRASDKSMQNVAEALRKATGE